MQVGKDARHNSASLPSCGLALRWPVLDVSVIAQPSDREFTTPQIVCSYLDQYKPYEYLLTLNVDAYVDQLAGKGSELSLAEVKGEVMCHLAELQAMEEQLPISITLGLVQVNCGKVSESHQASWCLWKCVQC